VGGVTAFGVDVTCSDNVTNMASARLHYVLLRRGILHAVPIKRLFVRTSANMDRFSTLFHWQVSEKIFYDRDFHLTAIMLLHYLPKFENSKLQPNFNFYHQK